MSRTASVDVASPDREPVWVACGRCGTTTEHKILAKVALSDATPDDAIQYWSDFLTIQCGGCRAVSFCTREKCSEDIECSDARGEHLAETFKVYPGRIAGRTLLKEFHELPHGVARIYKETHEALAAKLPILVGIGLRAILEAVCVERAAKGNRLVDQINDLVKQGVITQSGADILHSIRLLGNKAAHEVQSNKEEELEAAFDVVEHLIKTVYIIPAKAAKLRAKQKKPKSV